MKEFCTESGFPFLSAANLERENLDKNLTARPKVLHFCWLQLLVQIQLFLMQTSVNYEPDF